MLTLSTFRIGEDLFGIDAAAVQEATREWSASPVPLAPEDVVGLMNLRGEVITLIDLRRRLGYPERPAGDVAVNLVVRVHGEGVGLLVDELTDLATVDPASAGDTPPHALPGVRESVDHAFQLSATAQGGQGAAEAAHAVVLQLNVERATEVDSSVHRGSTGATEPRSAVADGRAERPSVSVASGRQG